MNNKTEGILYKVLKPYQYAGGEYLSCNKDFAGAKVKLALAFPDKYEIGISNLGLKILYDIVNRHSDFLADRVYAPDFDYREQLIKNNLPLCSIESRNELNKFDIIGFSLQYEIAYTSVLEMLRLAYIPVLRQERTETAPLIIAGGPSCFNPRPMQNFIDLFVIGDGEEVIIELMTEYYKLKQSGSKRNEIIKGLSNIKGVFSPEYPKKTQKRIYDISKDNTPKIAPVPYSSSVHDRTAVEIRRGCGRMCRFCQAGHINLPVRERRAEDIINMAKSETALAGYNEYSLLSLSSNDSVNIESIIEELNCEMLPKRISVSLPSQRIDRYSEKLAKLTSSVRKTTITLAPEAGSQRLRNVINKNLTEEQIINTVLNCYKSGAAHIKLYFMIGLPFETYEDIDETAELLKKIKFQAKQLRRDLELKDALNITCTLSIFVPKPFTPFQFHGQEAQSSVREKIKYLLEKTRNIKGVSINYHNGFTSKTECALSRGDEKYGAFLLALHQKGAYLQTWDENADKNLWEETARECGFDIDLEAQKTFDLDEELPWDIIDAGIDKAWLIEQYKNAQKAANIMPCEFNCVNCGVCANLKTHKVIDKPYTPILRSIDDAKNQIPVRYRLKLTKLNELRFISHLDWQNTITKMLYRSGLKLCFTQGFNPAPDFSLGIALPLFAESTCELIDIKIYDNMQEDELVKKLNRVLSRNMQVLKAEKIDKNTPAIDIQAQWAKYVFEPLNAGMPEGILQNENLRYIKDRILSSEKIIIEKKNKKGIIKQIDIRQSIKSIEAFVRENSSGGAGGLAMILKTGQDSSMPSVKPADLIKKFAPDTEFKITRTAFFDKDMNLL